MFVIIFSKEEGGKYEKDKWFYGCFVSWLFVDYFSCICKLSINQWECRNFGGSRHHKLDCAKINLFWGCHFFILLIKAERYIVDIYHTLVTH